MYLEQEISLSLCPPLKGPLPTATPIPPAPQPRELLSIEEESERLARELREVRGGKISVMQRPAVVNDSFKPIIINTVVVRDKEFLHKLGKVLKLKWLLGKEVQVSQVPLGCSEPRSLALRNDNRAVSVISRRQGCSFEGGKRKEEAGVVSVSYQLIPLCHSFEWDEQSSPLQNARSIFTSLSEEAHSCLVSTIGEKRVDLSLKFLQSGVKWLSDAVASALNMVIRSWSNVTEILESTGIDVKLPFQEVTPEGVIFVAQWALLVVVAYWIIAFILRLVVGAVRQALWLLKVTFAMGMFGLILSDAGASAETTAIRLAGLACVT
ncbi:uncharacterized protein [Sinocyclocheilus grahami]|nr:PREDICTED: uncharacterized protein LOC107556505 [Sinocyclocheilus grahami]